MRYLILLISSLFLFGCSHVSELETEVAGLKDEVSELKGSTTALCALNVEIISKFSLAYLGGDEFINLATGEKIKYDEMDDQCQEMVGDYLEFVKSRKEESPWAKPRSKEAEKIRLD